MQIFNIQSASGQDLILKFIRSLTDAEEDDCKDCIELFRKYQFELSAKYIKKISNKPKLWELRIKSRSEHRILFTINKQSIYLLHAFTKKTRKTPRSEITKAINRIKYR